MRLYIYILLNIVFCINVNAKNDNVFRNKEIKTSDFRNLDVSNSIEVKNFDFYETDFYEEKCTSLNQLIYGGRLDDIGYEILPDGKGFFYLVGETNSFSTDGTTDYFVVKINSNKEIIWAKKYGGSNNEYIRTAKLANDGSILIAGYTKSFTFTAGDMIVVNISTDGNMLWSRVFGINSSYPDAANEIIQLNNGDYVIVGDLNELGGFCDPVMIYLNKDMSFKWVKRFDSGTGEDSYGIIEIGEHLYMSSDVQFLSGIHYGLVISKFVTLTGQHLESYKYTSTGMGLFRPNIRKDKKDGFWIYGHFIVGGTYTTMNPLIIKLNDKLEIIKTYKLVTKENLNFNFTGFAFDEEDNFYFTASENAAGGNGYIFKSNIEGNLLWKNKLKSTNRSYLTGLSFYDNKIYAIGSISNGNRGQDIFMSDIDITTPDAIGCSLEKADGILQSENLQRFEFNYTINNFNLPLRTHALSQENIILNTTELCRIDTCIKIPIIKPKVDIPDTVCVNEVFNLKHDVNPKYAQWQFCNQVNTLNNARTSNSINVIHPIRKGKTIFYNNKNYTFYISNNQLYRLDYGSSLDNIPVEKLIFTSIGSSIFQNFEFIREEDNWYFFLTGKSISGEGQTVIVKLPFLDNLGIESQVFNNGLNSTINNITLLYEAENKIAILNDDTRNSFLKVNFGADWLSTTTITTSQITKPSGFANNLEYQFINYQSELVAFVVKDNSLHKVVYEAGNKLKGDIVFNNPELTGVKSTIVFKKCDEYFLVISTTADQIRIFKLNSEFSALTLISSATLPKEYNLADIFNFENGSAFTLFNPVANSIRYLISENCDAKTYTYDVVDGLEKLSYSKPGNYYIKLSADVYNPRSENVCKQIVVIGATDLDFVYLHDNCDVKNLTLKYNGEEKGIIKWIFNDGTTSTGSSAMRTLAGSSEIITMELTNRCLSKIEKLITIPEPINIPNLTIDTVLCALDTLIVKDVLFNEKCLSNNIIISKTDRKYALVSDKDFNISINDFELGENLIIGDIKNDFKTDFIKTNNVSVPDGYSIFYHKNDVNPNKDICYIENDTAQLIINHRTVNEKLIWEKSISVQKATSYRVSFDLRNILNYSKEDSIFVYINHKLLGTIDIGDYTCGSQNYSFFWTSGYNDTEISLSIKSKSIVFGNKVFSIKNLAIQPYKIVRKDIRVKYSSIDIAPVRDTALCLGLPLVFNVTNSGDVITKIFDADKNILFDQRINTYLPSRSTTAYVVSTNLLGCIKLDTFQIESINPPSLSLVSDTTFCQHFNGNINVAGADIYKWYNSLNEEVGIGNSYKTGNTNKETFTVVGSNISGCSDTASVNVDILVFDDYSFPNDLTICKNTNINLSAKGGDIVKWLDLKGNILGNNYTYNNTYNQAEAIIVELGKGGICAIRDTININLFPTEMILPFKDSIVCPNSEFTIPYRQLGIFNWSASSAIVQSSNESVTLRPKGNETFYISFNDINNCASVDSFNINVHDLPIKGIDKNKVDICKGTEVSFNAFGGDNYQWRVGNTNAGESSIFTNTYSNSTLVQVVVKEAFCLTQDTFNLNVNVKPSPSIVIEQPNTLSCNINSVRLNVTTDAQTIKWTPATNISNVNVINPIVSPTVTTTYKAIVTNDIGCTDSAQVTVSFDNYSSISYLMPDAFTPNGDGLNDCFGVSRMTNVNILQFDIFNRYGEKIFEGNNSNKCWNGYYKGHPQSTGTFVYIIRLETPCGKIERKGTVALIQ